MNNEDKVYHDLLGHVMHLLEHKLPVTMIAASLIRLLSEHHPIEMIAGCLMVIAQRLYKTHLSEEDYQRIMKIAYETNVEPYDIKKGTLH